MRLNMGMGFRKSFPTDFVGWDGESDEKPEILESIQLSLKCNEADDDFKGEVDAKEIFTHDDGRMGVEQDRLLINATTATVLAGGILPRGYGDAYGWMISLKPHGKSNGKYI